jgi:site-specific DNA-methyltransferase (adenine-specific)
MKTPPVSIVENLDCMEFMKGYPDKYFELAIVDPPYGIQRLSVKENRDPSTKFRRSLAKLVDSTNKWNSNKPTEDYFKELFRVSKYQIVWGANNFSLPESEYFIIWDKQQTVDNFASAEYAWTNYRMPAKVFTYSIHQHNQDEKIHPTQKPERLYYWILQKYAKQGDKILDTHLGSGSSRIAAYKLGFDFYGCEIDKEYFDKQEERFKKAIAEPLFDVIKKNNVIQANWFDALDGV